ncbi:MAG TPA: hypothetical protein VGH46_12400, partial [Gaiellaceae bacterium]
RRAVRKFFTDPSLAEPLAWHADWIVLRRDEPKQWRAIERLGKRPLYADKGFLVFRLAPLPLQP